MGCYAVSVAIRKKRDRTQEQLDQLRDVQRDPNPSISVVADALGSTSNYVIAKAAAIVEANGLRQLIPQLIDAFDRLMTDPRELDKGCAATTAIIKALYALDYQEPAPYRRGIRHRQEEGFGPTDTATELRGACAMGLAQTSDDGAMDELIRLLTDAEAPARLSAARAIGCRNDPAGIPALMLKIHLGDREVEVLAECLVSILSIALNDRTLSFVVEQLDAGDNDIAEAAALALGSVRDERAFDALRKKWDETPFGTMSERLLHAMALSRMEKAIEFLNGLIATEPPRVASMAVRALATHRRDPRIAGLLEANLEQRPELEAVIRAALNRSTL